MPETNNRFTIGPNIEDVGGGLIDLSDAPLHELLGREAEDVLAHALQRAIAKASRESGVVVSAFDSAIL